MRRVAILGAGGAGKSWLAAELGRCLNIAPVHLDALYYDGDWRPIPSDRWAEVQRAVITADRWIIEGNYLSTMQIRLAAADTVVFLDTPTSRRIVRVLRRRLTRSGPARPDVIGAERLDWRFLDYILMFNRMHRPRVLETCAAHKTDATLEILRTVADVHEFLSRAHTTGSATDPNTVRPDSMSFESLAGRASEPPLGPNLFEARR